MGSKFSHIKPKLLDWLQNHDDRWSFIIIYVGAAILLSLYAGLFWVMMLMLCHLLLEYFRHYYDDDVSSPFLHALWHTKLDIGLLFFALAITLYADTVMAALGLGQSARAAQAARGLQMAARFGVIESALRTFLLTADDMLRLVRAIWKTSQKRKGVQKPVVAKTEDTQEIDQRPPWLKPKIGDYCSLGFGILCATLILLTPILTDKSALDALYTLQHELSPFKAE